MSEALDLDQALAAIGRALAAGRPALSLRAETAADADAIDRLYASTRWDELAPLPWPETDKHTFLQQQSRLQADHYRKHYPGAALCAIVADAALVGRVYLYASPGEYRLMDIVLLPEWRRQGHGAGVLSALLTTAATQSRRVSLHVEADNPACAWYQRLGFRPVEQRGVYQFMAWQPATASAPL
ncbi:MAG: GNAT family N-acetyltransferase [Lysobacterales bacterium]